MRLETSQLPSTGSVVALRQFVPLSRIVHGHSSISPIHYDPVRLTYAVEFINFGFLSTRHFPVDRVCYHLA